jgi:ClpP class serine protease
MLGSETLKAHFDRLGKEGDDVDKAFFDSIVKDTQKKFIDHVIEVRGDRLKLKREELKDGEIYFGEDLIKTGLVDDVGVYRDIIEKEFVGHKVVDITRMTWRERVALFIHKLHSMSSGDHIHMAKLLQILQQK